MPIQINRNTVATVYDLTLVQNSHLQIEGWAKCHYFWS